MLGAALSAVGGELEVERKCFHTTILNESRCRPKCRKVPDRRVGSPKGWAMRGPFVEGKDVGGARARASRTLVIAVMLCGAPHAPAPLRTRPQRAVTELR